MPIRVTPELVKTIIETDLDNLIPFIKSANVIVESLLAEDSNLTNNQLEMIEMWLSAHFIAIRDPVVRAESIGDTRVDYWLGTVDGATGLKMTPYGQMALALDTSGRLASTSNAKRAELKSIDLEL